MKRLVMATAVAGLLFLASVAPTWAVHSPPPPLDTCPPAALFGASPLDLVMHHVDADSPYAIPLQVLIAVDVNGDGWVCVYLVGDGVIVDNDAGGPPDDDDEDDDEDDDDQDDEGDDEDDD